MTAIRKAVFPVAGLGTRFLPATKASPKEMLPIVDKPLIQYAVEEALAAGCTEMIFVTGRGKRAIEDHFDRAYEIEEELKSKGKRKMLEELEAILPPGVSCVYVRQPKMLGLGHAVLCAASVVGDEPFAVILADDLVDARVPALLQMVDVYARRKASVLGVENVPRDSTASYGIVTPSRIADRLHRVSAIVEKPKPSEAPSTLGVVGRYLLVPEIFDHLRRTTPGAGGEIQLTDAIASLLRETTVLAYEFEGVRYDCGSKLGYMKGCVDFALRHGEIGAAFARHLDGIARVRKPRVRR
jgi:UTP--glucose-1-phosphate uridylyltransferase